jgi:hypothetical protein
MCCWVTIFPTTGNYSNIVFIPKFAMIVNMLSSILNNAILSFNIEREAIFSVWIAL